MSSGVLLRDGEGGDSFAAGAPWRWRQESRSQLARSLVRSIARTALPKRGGEGASHENSTRNSRSRNRVPLAPGSSFLRPRDNGEYCRALSITSKAAKQPCEGKGDGGVYAGRGGREGWGAVHARCRIKLQSPAAAAAEQRRGAAEAR